MKLTCTKNLVKCTTKARKLRNCERLHKIQKGNTEKPSHACLHRPYIKNENESIIEVFLAMSNILGSTSHMLQPNVKVRTI